MAKVYEIISVELGGSPVTKPTIVKFQNGQLQPTNASTLQCAKYLDTKENKTIATVATNRLVYSGEEDTDDDVNTFIAIRNKKTNTVRLVQVNSASLQPQVKISSMLETTLNNSTLNVRSLYKQFGSKKTKRQTEQIEKMKTDATNVENELKEAVADIEIKEEDLVTPNVEDSVLEYRPKINRDATNVNDVYDLKTILSKNELNSLKDLAIEVRDKSTIKEQLTPFVLYGVNTLKESSVEDLEKYEILLYIDAVLKFFKTTTKKMKKLNIEPYPNIISEKILKEFTVISDNNRTRPLQMRDKAVCYILVLALIALNFKFEITSLSASINVGIKKLLDISRNIGAHSLVSKNENENQNFIILKIPLAAPVKGRFARKKK